MITSMNLTLTILMIQCNYIHDSLIFVFVCFSDNLLTVVELSCSK